MEHIIKASSGTCPYCGHVCDEIQASGYPKYIPNLKLVVRQMLCENCMIQFYEEFQLTYSGCVVYNGAERIAYDRCGQKRQT